MRRVCVCVCVCVQDSVVHVAAKGETMLAHSDLQGMWALSSYHRL